MGEQPFVQVPVALIDEAPAGVLATYCALAWHVDRRSRTGWPGWAVLADERGLDRRSIARHLAWLVDHGYIERLIPAALVGTGRRQAYRLPLDAPPSPNGRRPARRRTR